MTPPESPNPKIGG